MKKDERGGSRVRVPGAPLLALMLRAIRRAASATPPSLEGLRICASSHARAATAAPPSLLGVVGIFARHASKKAGGSTSNGRDSAGRRLGIKLYGGEHCKVGSIIARQRGTKWWPGHNVGIGVGQLSHLGWRGAAGETTRAERGSGGAKGGECVCEIECREVTEVALAEEEHQRPTPPVEGAELAKVPGVSAVPAV